jgi:hypothetical protein
MMGKIFMLGLIIKLACSCQSSPEGINQPFLEKDFEYRNIYNDTCLMLNSNDYSYSDTVVFNLLRKVLLIENVLFSNSGKNLGDLTGDYEIIGNYVFFYGDILSVEFENKKEDIIIVMVQEKQNGNHSVLGEFIFHEKYGIIISMIAHHRLFLKKIHSNKKVLNLNELQINIRNLEYFKLPEPPEYYE